MILLKGALGLLIVFLALGAIARLVDNLSSYPKWVQATMESIGMLIGFAGYALAVISILVLSAAIGHIILSLFGF